MVAALTLTLMVVLMPVMAVLIVWVMFKQTRSKRDLYFLLGFLAVTMFYIFAPDPSLIYKLYAEPNTDTGPLLLFSSLSFLFLALAVVVFRRYRE